MFPVETRFAPSENLAGEYILFRVGRTDFAMDAARVRGILPAQELKPFDGRHSWLCGFATMRGGEFPIVDLRRKLDLAPGSHGRFPCIVVVEVAASGGIRLIGFVADRVSRVVALRGRDFRNGIVRLTGRPRRVLDPDQILSEPELLSLLQLAPNL